MGLIDVTALVAGVDAFRPFALADFARLEQSVHPSVAAAAKAWTPAQRRAHCDRIPEPRTGAPMLCPACGEVFVQSRSSESSDTKDRAYVLELLTVPPRAA